jgi:hypothetical protein
MEKYLLGYALWFNIWKVGPYISKLKDYTLDFAHCIGFFNLSLI